MDVVDIIKQVRWCVDEETGVNDYEDTYFDNIVKAKIGAALRWCALYADAVLLNGDNSGSSTSGDGGMTHDYDNIGSTVSPTEPYLQGGYIVLPLDTVRVTRVKVSGWNKGVSRFISEDSDEYLQQFDNLGSEATKDRPVAALIQTTPLKIQPFPALQAGDTVEVSLIESPSDDEVIKTRIAPTGNVQYVNVPPKLASAVVYYLAYLVMCAHNDVTKASSMLQIAKEQIAANTK